MDRMPWPGSRCDPAPTVLRQVEATHWACDRGDRNRVLRRCRARRPGRRSSSKTAAEVSASSPWAGVSCSRGSRSSSSAGAAAGRTGVHGVRIPGRTGCACPGGAGQPHFRRGPPRRGTGRTHLGRRPARRSGGGGVPGRRGQSGRRPRAVPPAGRPPGWRTRGPSRSGVQGEPHRRCRREGPYGGTCSWSGIRSSTSGRP